MTKSIVIVIVLLISAAPTVIAKRLYPERWYQADWCQNNNGQMEVTLADGTRADCITKKHALEFDFSDNWAESIGQSLFYSLQTGKRAGVVLILENKSDYRFLIRLNTAINHFQLPIDVWSIGAYEQEPDCLP